MKKILVLTSLIIALFLLVSGCKADKAKDNALGEPPLITQYTGVINKVSANEMLVYVFIGYSGEMIARINEETIIDDSLKLMITPDNLITFTTDGTITMSAPPQVTVASINIILEGVVFEGRVFRISGDIITVDITYPKSDRMIAGITPDTVFADGVSEYIKVGNIIRFETAGIMTLSEPPRMNVVRFTKNE
jgi:hypothetical protein